MQLAEPLKFAIAHYCSPYAWAHTPNIRQALFPQPTNVLALNSITAIMMFGPLLLAAALIGYILHRHREGSGIRRMVYILLVLPPLFTVTTLLIWIGEMTYWFNSRFLILLSPLILVLAAVFLNN